MSASYLVRGRASGEWFALRQLNDGEYAFRVMLETEGDDIYVAYDEMDKYAWAESSQAKVERYRIISD